MKQLSKYIAVAVAISIPYLAHAEDGMENARKFQEHNRQTFLLQKQRHDREVLAKAHEDSKKTAQTETAEGGKSGS
ncbi:hypothetical protein NP554_13505 [Pseudomonas asiatica]|uniref:Secreted protein n=1 Tax=Pseudomonas asiatica TaxID=2219225 RepID=A0A9X4I0K6_9PSED|nr:hypothetical protein [Pseudomonas asiatica]MEE1901422.1 hypothetical protein [Pseudomonas inefficax]MDD2112794.1 hypothetical protein [Pseudomonas asiatica]MEE1906666.1 hypothetical protein [Pseudomonas inefficax]MEE1983314.1 hypothetical protein [Pseudomonas inefficax]WJN48186.1 hypothetical protein QUR91_16140 [Pseudomonas asiatica]